jgi:hypothetical protein
MFSSGRETGELATLIAAAVLPVLLTRVAATLRPPKKDVLDQDGTNREIPVDRARARQ